jgi:riboflavin kinase/FMN adenylyltransferase
MVKSKDTLRAPLMRFPQIVPNSLRGGAITIGNFDGMHIGHERVIHRLKEVACSNNRPSVLVTFYPHPIRVLKPQSNLRYISSVREKAERCGELGIDLVYFVHFTAAFSQISADDFIQRVLVDSLSASDLVVGEDVAIGRNREGDISFLENKLPAHGIRLHRVAHLSLDGVKAGSRKIRELIAAGEVEAAKLLIGEPFTISSRVGHGDKRGSAIGFPTANIAVANRLIPRRGVYACKVELEGRVYKAVANIGVRPTFSGESERLEVHILDLSPRSLYGVRIHVSFIKRLRDENKFDSIGALREQISLDVVDARAVLEDG